MPFSDMMNDKIVVLKKDGTKIKDIQSVVLENEIYTNKGDFIVESGDFILRQMSNGGEETYEVIDPGFFEGMRDHPAHYQMKVKKVDLREKVNTVTETKPKNSDIDMTKVFIVHGHDELAKSEVARFIEKMNFEPIILHEKASSGSTIIEKIEKYTDVGFGVVLYTPCDIGAKKIEDPDLRPRARQNVVFEHGFLNGKLGRQNVCALVKGEIETPNDISGVVYVPLDDYGAWKLSLAKEMRNSGYAVDMNKL